MMGDWLVARRRKFASTTSYTLVNAPAIRDWVRMETMSRRPSSGAIADLAYPWGAGGRRTSGNWGVAATTLPDKS